MKINVAILLTLIRIMLIPPLLFTMWQEQWWYALTIFIIACSTDVLDGYVARIRKEETVLGAVLDTLSDKVLFLSVLGVLIFKAPAQFVIPAWFVAFFVAREVLVLVGATWLFFTNTQWQIKPSPLAKRAGFVRVLFVALVVSSYVVADMPSALLYVIMYSAVALEVLACVQYITFAVIN